jgi:hypothetical protein
MARASAAKRWGTAFLAMVITYGVLEIVLSLVAWAGWWGTSLMVFEDSGRTWHFDPIRGFWLGRTPSRFARITNGRLEYVGIARGNAQGFPDRDDFTPARSRPGTRRYAVFGDSFTEGQFLGQSWPDRAEDLARARGEPVEYLNFSASGGGLANWWSVLTRYVAVQEEPLDGVIFAVFAGDLQRKFTIWDHREPDHPLFGRVPSWDPETYPLTFEAARPVIEPQTGLWILSAEEFERVLQGSWPSQVPRPFRPYLLTTLWRAFRSGDPQVPRKVATDRDPARERLIGDMARVLAGRHLPALVVHIPDRQSLLDPTRASKWPEHEAREFASAVGARFLDATAIFDNLSPEQIRALFLPYDGHWNQAGSNRFAAFLDRECVRAFGHSAE